MNTNLALRARTQVREHSISPKHSPSTRSRRFRFESVELPSHVKSVRMIGLESARDHVVTGEELREHSLSPKRRHVPSSRAERRFSLSRENVTRAANVRHRRIDDAHDHVLEVEEVRGVRARSAGFQSCHSLTSLSKALEYQLTHILLTCSKITQI